MDSVDGSNPASGRGVIYLSQEQIDRLSSMAADARYQINISNNDFWIDRIPHHIPEPESNAQEIVRNCRHNFDVVSRNRVKLPIVPQLASLNETPSPDSIMYPFMELEIHRLECRHCKKLIIKTKDLATGKTYG